MLYDVLIVSLFLSSLLFILYLMNKGKKAYLFTNKRETALEALVCLLIFNQAVVSIPLTQYVGLAWCVKVITLSIAAYIVIFSFALFIHIFFIKRKQPI